MKLFASVLLVSFLCLVRTVTALDCSNKTLQFCLDYLSRDGLDIDHIDDDLPTWNATVSDIQDRCRTFDKFTECMSGVTERCSSRKYEGWIDAYDYLCKKSNLTLVVDYLECYTSPPVVSSADSLCKHVFEFRARELLNGSSTVPRDKQADYCKLADSFFACLNKTLTTNCGEDAAKWQWTWDRTLSMPILQTCPGWSTTEVDNNGDSGTSATTTSTVKTSTPAGVATSAATMLTTESQQFGPSSSRAADCICPSQGSLGVGLGVGLGLPLGIFIILTVFFAVKSKRLETLLEQRTRNEKTELDAVQAQSVAQVNDSTNDNNYQQLNRNLDDSSGTMMYDKLRVAPETQYEEFLPNQL